MAIKIAEKIDYDAHEWTPVVTSQRFDFDALNQRVVGPKPVGRPPSGKQMVTLRLSPEVVEKFKATGPGWQSRINDVLKAAKV